MTLYEWLNMLISLLLPLAAGYALVFLLCRHCSLKLLPALALAYGLGMGIVSQIMLLLGMMNTPFNMHTIRFYLVLILGIMLYILLRQTRKSSSTLLPKDSTLWDNPLITRVPINLCQKLLYLIGFFYIFYNIFFVCWHSLNIPVHHWDAVATVTFKAKVFFFDGSLHKLNLPHSSYPLHVSFLQSWIALNLNRWDEYLINIIFPLTSLAFLILHYYFLKSRTNSLWAVGGLCLLLSSNLFVYHATIPYVDFSLMYYNCTAILLLLTWNQKKYTALLILASLFAGLTTFVKLEGTIYLILYTVLLILMLKDEKLYSWKEKWTNFLTFVIPSYSIAGLFHYYKNFVGITGMEGRIKFTFSPDLLERLPTIIDYFWLSLFYSGNWNILWSMLVVGLFFGFGKIRHHQDIQLLCWMTSMFFAAYLIFFIFTPTPINYYNTTSRVVLHFFPLVIWLIILLYYPQNTNDRPINDDK